MKALPVTHTSPHDRSPNFEDRQRLRSGNAAALQRLFDSHFASIYRRVFSQVRNPLDAEDITQDVFLKIQSSLPKLDPAKAIDPWISTILRNRIIDHWRSLGNRRDSFSYDAEEEQTFFPESAAPPPSGLLEQMEGEQIVRTAIDHLPAKLRAVLDLRFYEGFSFEDISKKLKLTAATARKRYSRALEALRSSPALAALHLLEASPHLQN